MYVFLTLPFTELLQGTGTSSPNALQASSRFDRSDVTGFDIRVRMHRKSNAPDRIFGASAPYKY
ncbi:hypothetical protein IQ270_21865 [Microcoleus sp. LEGE 07076]|uniref:hypothetical protein n=1 Tax=Microcoleus sp. LEGE 07076 TaxID=915322 RepID=UPI001882287D|nr:hypothetical protein [Microcoleus sp. LEGE 07076]MBE9187224.1 hypothetical protein [Microcoleus sp. LEGE 07076]